MDLKPGQDAFIDCVTSGLPHPRIEWYMTSELGVRSQLSRGTTGENHAVHTDGLELHNVSQQLSGSYECDVENSLGRDSRTARLRVEGKNDH